MDGSLIVCLYMQSTFVHTLAPSLIRHNDNCTQRLSITYLCDEVPRSGYRRENSHIIVWERPLETTLRGWPTKVITQGYREGGSFQFSPHSMRRLNCSLPSPPSLPLWSLRSSLSLSGEKLLPSPLYRLPLPFPTLGAFHV